MIWTDNHPEYETLNPQLEEWVRFLPEMEEDGDGYTNLRVTKRTSYHEYPKIFRELAEWVMNTDQFSLSFPEFKVEIWGAIYNKGDYAVPHTHGDGEIVSFVYYVNCVEGSSPLIFSEINQTYKPKNGLCIMWNGNERHEVPPNEFDNRVIIAGNFYKEGRTWN
ncbi:MAG: hypothetical protein CL855_08315 [Cryomorphaceae bacterium]|nr:hypothetical protein [Cryomorphaceae bacterium]|tara:strand:+ start:1915 stop:2406 length:492 start_codon:yes stop_codon:yes gene_type:complete